MKAIGGYFGLELNIGKEYYPNLIKLNTGRNCLKYILKVRNYKRVYIPYYTCEVILEPFKKLKIDYEFYHIDEELNPVFDKQLNEGEAILINNYFGIRNNRIINICRRYKNIIVDNSQAFYSKPIKDIDTFYSPRKFFGIPDGGYLFTNKRIEGRFERDISIYRMEHLLKRIDIGPEEGYEDFKKNDKSLDNQPIKYMSNLTQRILQSIDYEYVKKKRNENFAFLHSLLEQENELTNLIKDSDIEAPMIYPFLTKRGKLLREKLLMQKIFVATYWPNVNKWAQKNTW